jgi:hypothetical protein
MLPLTLWSPQTAMILWFFLNVLMLTAGLSLIFLQFGSGISILQFAFSILFSVFFLPVLSSIWLGQLSIFSFFILALTTYLFSKQRWAWLSVVLGLSFIKPQVMIMLAGLILLCALFHHRWEILLGFGAVVAVLILISLPFISSPGQIVGGGIAKHLAEYIQDTSTIWGLFLQMGIPWVFALLVSIALIIWLILLWWPFMGDKAISLQDIPSLFSAAVLVNLITIPYSWMHNLALLLLPIGYCLALAYQMDGKWRAIWLAVLFGVMHPLMLGLYISLPGPKPPQAYQVIPALLLLPLMFFMIFQKNRSIELSGGKTC